MTNLVLLTDALKIEINRHKAIDTKATIKIIIQVLPRPFLIVLPQSSNQLQSKLFIKLLLAIIVT